MANSTDELLKKLQELEAGHAYLKTEMSKLLLTDAGCGYQRPKSLSSDGGQLAVPSRQSNALDVVVRRKSPAPYGYRQRLLLSSESESEMESGSSALSPSPDRMCLNILDSLGQAVHVIDMQRRIAYW